MGNEQLDVEPTNKSFTGVKPATLPLTLFFGGSGNEPFNAKLIRTEPFNYIILFPNNCITYLLPCNEIQRIHFELE